ncbi:hypothetical protein KY289_023089 [Solanum tuberosum]|nr:hypothetical protein KY289_023089 [Solanum tuberosum]
MTSALNFPPLKRLTHFEELQVLEVQEQSVVSYHALTGGHSSSTLRYLEHINGSPVQVLLDGRSDHSFVQTLVANFLQPPVDSTPNFSVMACSGQRLHCEGVKGKLCVGKGIFQNTAMPVQLHSLRRYVATDAIFSYYCLQVVQNEVPNEEVTNPVLVLILYEFSDVFLKPKGLPPSRSQDHVIHLNPGDEPVSVKSYRYPYYQK